MTFSNVRQNSAFYTQPSTLLMKNNQKKIFISGSSVIVWKQTERIISAGEHLLRKDSRMTLIKSPNGINLQIANVTPDDRGK